MRNTPRTIEEESFDIIVKALELAQAKGVFTLKDSTIILHSIDTVAKALEPKAPVKSPEVPLT